MAISEIIKPPAGVVSQYVAAAAATQGTPQLAITPTAQLPGVPTIFAQLGFSVPTPPRPRLFVTSEGAPGTGKTHFLRTMPGPIALFDFDRGAEGVLDVYKNADGIPVNMYGQPILRKTVEFAEFDEGGKTMSAVEQQAARVGYQMLKYVFETLSRSPDVRTIAVDTGGAAYALAQAARFGQLAVLGEVPAQVWTSMQAEFENIFLRAYDAGCNVLVTHRQGAKFKGLMGEKELKGYKPMEHVSQVHLVHNRRVTQVPDPSRPGLTIPQSELSMTIKKCRQRSSLVGTELTAIMLGENADGVMESMGTRFVDVATTIFPRTSEADWV